MKASICLAFHLPALVHFLPCIKCSLSLSKCNAHTSLFEFHLPFYYPSNQLIKNFLPSQTFFCHCVRQSLRPLQRNLDVHKRRSAQFPVMLPVLQLRCCSLHFSAVLCFQFVFRKGKERNLKHIRYLRRETNLIYACVFGQC